MLKESTRTRHAASAVETPTTREPLTKVASRLRSFIKRGAAIDGFLGIEVMHLAETWESRKAEAGGMELGPWLRKHVHPSRSLAWYERKARGVRAAKTHGIAGRMDSTAVCWWADNVPEKARAATAQLIRDAWFLGKRVVLNRGKVARLCAPFVSRRTVVRIVVSEELQRLRARIERLEAQIRALGAKPVE
jgi:hypothetical protein